MHNFPVCFIIFKYEGGDSILKAELQMRVYENKVRRKRFGTQRDELEVLQLPYINKDIKIKEVQVAQRSVNWFSKCTLEYIRNVFITQLNLQMFFKMTSSVFNV
jgi:hypothetical protein